MHVHVHRFGTDAVVEAGAGCLTRGVCYHSGSYSYLAPHEDTALMLLSACAQVHLFDINIPGGVTFKESETLTAGRIGTVVDTDAGRLGIGICYDIRFPELAMMYAQRGAQLLVYPGVLSLQHWRDIFAPSLGGALTAMPMAQPAQIRAGDGDGKFPMAAGQYEAISVYLARHLHQLKAPVLGFQHPLVNG